MRPHFSQSSRENATPTSLLKGSTPRDNFLHKREMFGRFNRVQLEEDIGNWTVYPLMNINEAGIDITVDSETQFNEGSSLE